MTATVSSPISFSTLLESGHMFACPHPGASPDALLNSPYLRTAQLLFFKNCLNIAAEGIDQHPQVFSGADALVEMVCNFFDDDQHIAAAQLLRSATGYAIHNTLHGQDESTHLRGVVNLILLMAFASTKDVYWQLQVPEPMDLMLFGRLYHVDNHLGFSRQNHHIVVTFDSAEIGFTHDVQSDSLIEAVNPLFVTICGRRINIVLAEEATRDFYLSKNEELCHSDRQLIVRDLQQAADYLQHHSPMYAQWVADVLQEFIVVGRTPQGTINRSNSDTPGSIAFSYPPAEPDDFPQIFVHEATHNYAHLYEVFDPLNNGLDTNKYYSPAKRSDRPIDRILMTYHAFSNVILFLRECIDTGATNTGYLARELDDTFLIVDPLVPYLRETPGLTPCGHACWTPLYPKIQALSLGGNHA